MAEDIKIKWIDEDTSDITNSGKGIEWSSIEVKEEDKNKE